MGLRWGPHCGAVRAGDTLLPHVTAWGQGHGVYEPRQRNHHGTAAPERGALPRTKPPHKIRLVLLEADFERNQRKKVLTTSECPISFVLMTWP